MNNDLYCSVNIRMVTSSRRLRYTVNVACMEKKLQGDLGVGGRIILKLTVMLLVDELWVDHLVEDR